MTLLLIAYLGGVLTIASPCILPVLPFVFSRVDGRFSRQGLPLLLGMVLTFAGVASLAAVGGEWAIRFNEYGRWAALWLMGVFGLTLLVPGLADNLMKPLVTAGQRLTQSVEGSSKDSVAGALILGAATGLLWAPCAGPILGLVLTGAALGGVSAQTSLLLLAYAAGAATSLAAALLIGGRVFQAMKQFLRAGEWLRRGLGGALVASVVAIALGWDTDVLARWSSGLTSTVEQRLLDHLGRGDDPVAAQNRPAGAMSASNTMTSAAAQNGPAMSALPTRDVLPAGQESLAGAVEWLNSPALSLESLRGKVVLVDFWTYSCINCLRVLPYVSAWAKKYADQGLVVVGVHTPEFAFEKNIDNVRRATEDLSVTYPVAIDNNFAIWRSFKNRYWPAHYFIDARGRVRHTHFGEGEYDKAEQVIVNLLAEARGGAAQDSTPVQVDTTGVAQAADMANVRSHEAYLGYRRADNVSSPGGIVPDQRRLYSAGSPRLNEWGLAGEWTVSAEHAELAGSKGTVVHRFHARDVNLVLNAPSSAPVRFRVLIDGKPPGANRGSDVDAEGYGVANADRLYQLVRQSGAIADRTFEIQFLSPGVRVFAFTFG